MTFNLSAAEKCYVKLTCKANLNQVCDSQSNDVKTACSKCPNPESTKDNSIYTTLCETYIPYTTTSFPKISSLYTTSKEVIAKFNSDCAAVEKAKMGGTETDPKDIYMEVYKYCSDKEPVYAVCTTKTPTEISPVPSTPKEISPSTKSTSTLTPTVNTFTNKNIMPGSYPQIDNNNPVIQNGGQFVTQIANCRDFVISKSGGTYSIDSYNYGNAKQNGKFIDNKMFTTTDEVNNYLKNICNK